VRFSVSWNGAWQGYSVSVPDAVPAGEPVEVVTLDEHKAVLCEIRARVGNFGGFQNSQHGGFYVDRDDVLRLIDEYMRTPAIAPERSSEQCADAPITPPLGETRNTTNDPR
jgi:hypothetical protein